MFAVVKRTFEAAGHPKGSDERARLNCHPVTSEYMTSYRYAVVDETGKSVYSAPTKAEAQEKADQLNTRIPA